MRLHVLCHNGVNSISSHFNFFLMNLTLFNILDDRNKDKTDKKTTIFVISSLSLTSIIQLFEMALKSLKMELTLGFQQIYVVLLAAQPVEILKCNFTYSRTSQRDQGWVKETPNMLGSCERQKLVEQAP